MNITAFKYTIIPVIIREKKAPPARRIMLSADAPNLRIKARSGPGKIIAIPQLVVQNT
jgi:hypothetical protein